MTQTLHGSSVLSRNCSVTLRNLLNSVEVQVFFLSVSATITVAAKTIYSSFIPLLPPFEQIPNFAQVFPTPNSIEES